MAAKKWSAEDLLALEKLVDRYDVASMLESLSDICHEKAEHIADNWGDVKTAKTWARAGIEVGSVSHSVKV